MDKKIKSKLNWLENNILPYQREFLSFLKNKKYNMSTIQSYGYGLSDFSGFLEENKVSLYDLTLNNINFYIDFLRTRDKSGNSINVNVSCLKKYFNFLAKNHKITLTFDYNDIKQIKIKKQNRKEINIKSLDVILNFIGSKKDLSSKRNFIILQLIIKTGMRISELVKIKKQNFKSSQIVIDNNFYILDRILNKQIENFINNSKTNEGYLFIPYRARKDSKNNNLTVRSVERMIKKHFPYNNYNDLKLVYFKQICGVLPNITKICRHELVSKIELKNINRII